MRYKADHKENTRAMILKEAGVQLLAAGPEGVHVAEIMSKAGLTHGGFYAHFASKDDLVVAAIAQKFANSRAAFQDHMEGRLPAEGMRRYIDAYLSKKHRDAVTTGCPLPRLLATMPSLSPDALETLRTGLSRYNAGLARHLKKLGHARSSDLARSIVAEMVGTLSVARAWGNSKTSDDILRRARSGIKRRLGL